MFNGIPSLPTVLSGYASISAIIMLLRSVLNELLPEPVQSYLSDKFSDIFSYYFSTSFTFIIEDRWQAVDNETFRVVEAYLPTRVGPSTDSLMLGSNDCHNPKAPPKIVIPVNTVVKDEFEGIKISWILRSKEYKSHHWPVQKNFFELWCKKKSREVVMNRYIPHVLKIGEQILNEREVLGIYTYDQEDEDWQSTVFKHPSNFETLAMEQELKEFIMKDLDMFVKRKGYFERVGRAWKRGFLLYGPPGTGKSSLVAAIANYMRYDIYDLQLQSVKSDADLRRLLTSTTNKSILLIEDIDCTTKVSNERKKQQQQVDSDESDDEDDRKKCSSNNPGATLSGLLNFIDGLWSSCGDERIIIFTTNHKNKLDQALLRPGRMDVHVYMGHCTPSGFRKLVSTYLGIENHKLFDSIEDLIRERSITTAEVAQQLMKSDNPDVALQSLVEFINSKTEETSGEMKEQQLEVVKKKNKLQTTTGLLRRMIMKQMRSR